MSRIATGLPEAVALPLILIIWGFGSDLAVAQSRFSDAFSVPSIMVEEPQTPKQPKRGVQERPHTQKPPERTVHIPRGSAGFVPPAPSSGQLARTPLLAP